MEPRIRHREVAPGAVQALLALEKHVRQSGLDKKLLDLVYLRVSQINGCAFCVAMHAKDLRNAGEPEHRVYSLPVWRDAPFYTDRERAALAWAEAVTTLGEGHVGDAVYEEARKAFGEAELVELTLAIGTINVWNRFGVAFRLVPER